MGLGGVPELAAEEELVARGRPFLAEVVASLEMEEQVAVLRGRADSSEVRTRVDEFDVVTARAVAPLDRLIPWALPLARLGGRLLALKGRRAETELSKSQKVLASTGGVARGIQTCGVGMVDPPTRVVVIERATRTAR